jgi:hypothetical protein
MVPDRLWYCTVQTVLLGAVCSHVPDRPTFRQSFTDKWGVVGWGKQKMFMFDWSALMTLQKTTLDSVSAVTLGIYLYGATSHSTGKALAKMAQSYILTWWGV